MRQGGGGYGASSPRLRAFLLGRSLFVAKEMVVVVRLVELVAVVVVQVNTGVSYRVEGLNGRVPAIILELLQARKDVCKALRPPAVLGCSHAVFPMLAAAKHLRHALGRIGRVSMYRAKSQVIPSVHHNTSVGATAMVVGARSWRASDRRERRGG